MKRRPVYIAAFILQPNIIENWWKKEIKIPFLVNKWIDHVTVDFQPSVEDFNNVSLGERVNLKVDGYINHRDVQIVRIRGINSTKTPHITISTARDITPKFSKEIISTEKFIGVKGPKFVGKIGYWDGKVVRFDK